MSLQCSLQFSSQMMQVMRPATVENYLQCADKRCQQKQHACFNKRHRSRGSDQVRQITDQYVNVFRFGQKSICSQGFCRLNGTFLIGGCINDDPQMLEPLVLPDKRKKFKSCHIWHVYINKNIVRQ